MSQQVLTAALGEGMAFTSVTDRKFKHNRLSVNLVVPLAEETAAPYAVLPFVLRKGCAAYPDFTLLNQRLGELYGAALGADVSKIGSNQVVSLSITSVDDRLALQGEAVTAACAQLLCDLLLHPNQEQGAFLAQDFALEQQYLVDTIQAEINDKRSYALAQMKAVMNAGDPSALGRYGTVAGARALDARQAWRAWQRLLEQAHIEVVMAGAGDPAPVREVFGRQLGALGRQVVPLLQTPRPAPAVPPRERTERLDVTQAKLVMGFRTGEQAGEEERAAMKVLAALYGGTPFSRLFMNVREKLSLCYYCAARFDRATGMLVVDSGVEFENCRRAQQEILAQLAQLQAAPPPAEELENTKRLLVSSVRAAGDSLSGLEGWCLAQRVLGTGLSLEEEIRLLQGVDAGQVARAAAQVQLDTVYLLTGKEEATHG